MSSAVYDSGSLHVRLAWRDGSVVGIGVALERPNATVVLRGKPADQAVRQLPLLYAICGKAQGLAAALALRAARGETVPRQVDPAVRAEGLREHLWRLLLDWPRALGQAPAEAFMAEALRRSSAADFVSWLAPPLADHCEQLAAALPDSVGSLRPRLVAALQARRDGLLADAGLGSGEAAPLAPGVGRATVWTARGLLQHDLRVADDRLVELVIQAPTDRHFADGRLLDAWLAGHAAIGPADLRVAAEFVLLALDPCVPWHIVIDDVS